MTARTRDELHLALPLPRHRSVPLWRQAAGLGALAALGLGWAGFGYLTSGPRIRGEARELLERLIGGEVEIAAAEFDLFDGIHLSQVSVAIPADSDFAPPGASRSQREVFQAGDLYLKVNPFRLLVGQSGVSEIVAVDPTFTLVRRASDGRSNWQELFRTRLRRPRRGAVSPVLRLRNAAVRVFRLEGGARFGEEALTVHALARPDPQEPDVYHVDHWQLDRKDPTGRLAINISALSLRITQGSLPEVTIALARTALPPGAEELEKWLTLLDLRGRVTSDDLVVDPQSGSRALIHLRDVSLSLPLSDEESRRPPDQRFVQLRSASGTLRFEGRAAHLQVRAVMRGSPCELDISAEGLEAAARDLADLGLRARVRVEELVIPSDQADPNSPSGRLVGRWDAIRGIFERFSPSGLLDLEVELLKPAGREQRVRLESARFQARGVTVTYHQFPYRFEDLHGEAVLSGGGLRFQNLVGRHGDGRIVVNGTMADLTPQTALDLTFEGGDIGLDEDLAAALKARHASMYRQFSPSGRADVTVHIWRGPAADGRSDPMNVLIDADLKGAVATFGRFPYPLSGITGRLHMANELIELHQVAGRNGDGLVTLEGWVRDGGSRLDVTLQAQDLAADDPLIDALPPTARSLVAPCGLRGTVDVQGRLFRESPAEPVGYDLAARLKNGRILHRSLPYEINAVSGTLRITPGRVVIQELLGTHGDSSVFVSGELASRHDLWAGELTVHSPRLALDEDLHAALPERLGRLWQTVRVGGPVQMTSRLALTSGGGRTTCRQQTELEALSNSVELADLPLTMSRVAGKIVIDDREAVLHDLRADCGEGSVKLNGRLSLGEGERRGSFNLVATNVALDEGLRQAIPWRLRRMWNDVQPGGRFDLELPVLAWSQAANGTSAWTFAGQLEVSDADMNLGLRVRHTFGKLECEGHIAGGGDEFEIRGRLRVPSTELNGRQFQDVRGHLEYADVDAVLRLSDLSGRIHQGQVAGSCEVTFGDSRTEYDLSLVVREMSLSDLLNATRAADAVPLEATGVVSGSLYLSGPAGDKTSRRGGGDVFINQGQLFQLPLFLEILEASQVEAEDPLAQQQARVKFFLQGDTLQLDRLEMRGGGLSILGVGTLGLDDDQLDITLLTAKPTEWPELPLITEFLQGATRELMEVRVEGSLAEPRVRGRPLRSVDSALRTLFQGSRSSPRDPLDE